MRTERAVARLAPRSPWQAMDLGGVLYRQWWLPLLRIWLVVTLPPFLLLVLVFGDQLFIGSLVFWWLKPLWERPLLEFQARAMFGEQPTVRTLLREARGYLSNGLMASLTWRRLSPARSFNLPAFQLEEQRGEALQRRLRVLHLPPNQNAGWLTIIMLHIEQAMAFALLTLLYLLLPWQFNVEFVSWLEDGGDGWLMLTCWYLVLCVTEPLYVASGFALYLNRRTVLEGWDMETGLRAIARRRPAGSGMAVALILLPLLFLVPSAEAAPEDQDPQSEAAEILSSDDFMPMEVRNRIRWRDSEAGPRRGLLERLFDWLLNREESQQEWQVSGAGLLLDALRVLMWLLAILAVAWLLHQAGRRWLPLTGTDRGSPRPPPWQPEILRHPLPGDIPAAAGAALAAGDIRTAISLLYRASLVRLAADYQLGFPEGATEQECLAITHARIRDDAADTAGFLGRLAGAWTATAWAHRPPSREQTEALLADWRRHFDTARSSA